MIEEHIRDFLRDDADITDRVGPNIWDGHAPGYVKGEMLIVSTITSTPVYTIDGEAGKAEHVVQIMAFAARAKAAFTLSELVRNRLSGYRGAIGDDDASSVERCEIVSGGAGEVAPEDKSDNWTFTYRNDYALFETTTIPTLV